MRVLAPLLALGLLLVAAAPPAAADHVCDMMPQMDPMELATCVADGVVDHLLAGEQPECECVP